MKFWAWAGMGLLVGGSMMGTACGGSDTTSSGGGGASGSTNTTSTTGKTSSTVGPVTTTGTNTTSGNGGAGGGTGTPTICGQPDTGMPPDAMCDSCITNNCCTEFNAAFMSMDTGAYLQCILGPNLDGMGGCFASNPPTSDLAGFQACWGTCITNNKNGADLYDAFNSCIASNHCIDNDMACQQAWLLTPGICDTMITVTIAECDSCLGANCCTDAEGCLTDNTCANDFFTCVGDPTQGVCTTDAAAGTFAQCATQNCSDACGITGAGGGGAGGGAGAGGGTAGSGGGAP